MLYTFSEDISETGNTIFYNAAVTSLCNTFGKTVVTREADMVTAHGNYYLFYL